MTFYFSRFIIAFMKEKTFRGPYFTIYSKVLWELYFQWFHFILVMYVIDLFIIFFN